MEFLIWYDQNYDDKHKKKTFSGNRKEVDERLERMKKQPFLKMSMKWVEK